MPMLIIINSLKNLQRVMNVTKKDEIEDEVRKIKNFG